MIKIISFIFLSFMIVFSPVLLAADQAASKLIKLNGEILEVEELKEPLGSAIYTIKDLSSGQTLKLFADRYRSTIKVGDTIKGANDMLGGSKAIIIYQASGQNNLPEIVFAKVTNSIV